MARAPRWPCTRMRGAELAVIRQSAETSRARTMRKNIVTRIWDFRFLAVSARGYFPVRACYQAAAEVPAGLLIALRSRFGLRLLRGRQEPPRPTTAPHTRNSRCSACTGRNDD